MLTKQDIKLCQSCIERQYNPPQPATREWQPGIYYCEDCFGALINNMINIAPAEINSGLERIEPGPVLQQIYQLLNIPTELQFDSVDRTCKHRDKIFNFHAPSNINKDIDTTAREIEEYSICLFQFQYKIETLKIHIDKLKEQRRIEKGLKSYDDSKEEYSKVKKPSNVKASQQDKLKKAIGAQNSSEMDELIKTAQALEKKKRERQFNILAGNCADCGGVKPCKEHPNSE
jgi:hypothetical protein